jgi:hypothetical protein
VQDGILDQEILDLLSRLGKVSWLLFLTAAVWYFLLTFNQ